MSEENDTNVETDVENVEDSQNENHEADSDESEKDWKAEAEKWKALSRKNEERAKANSTAAEELEKVRKANLSEQEKAVESARESGRKEAMQEVALRLVDAEVRVAASGRNINVDGLLEGLDRGRFVTEDGDVDREKVTSFIDGLAPKSRATATDYGQGVRGTNTKKSTADLFADATGDF